jgi:uncharacterized membrane protein YhaH (DUF805 family)
VTVRFSWDKDREPDMGSFSLFNLLLGTVIIAIVSPIVLAPVALILRRAGFSRWWCVLWAIPFVNIIALWVFALVPWPALSAQLAGEPAA